MTAFVLELADEADTDRAGAALARGLPRGAVLTLDGPLGAGKTRLTQAIAAALGIDRREVTSPTFVLCQTLAGEKTLHHYDVYRVRDDDEFLELGPEESFAVADLTVIEWGSRVASCLPADVWRGTIEPIGETRRRLTIEPPENATTDWLARTAREFIMTRTPLRSPDLMSRGDTALLVVDLQEKLVPAIDGHARIVWNARRLIEGATALGVPVVATEQYPKGLGATVEPLRSALGAIPEKLRFSAAGCEAAIERVRAAGVSKILVIGVEAHVCVQQTALDLLAEGFRVYAAVDAVGSRFAIDRDVAMRRMESAGVALVTTEAALFEWCEAAGTPEFKRISALVREPGPTPA